MRKLSIKDAFTLARIIKKADIKEEIADFANCCQKQQQR